MDTKYYDLHDYNSPIKDINGRVPYNSNLWPTESWWPNHTKKFQYLDSRFHFGIIALLDGRFSIEGFIPSIEKNTDNPYPSKNEKPGLPVVFESRNKAIRTAAARMLRTARWARKWRHCSVDNETLSKLNNWTLEEVARAINAPIPVRKIHLKNPSPPKQMTGLELFDFESVIAKEQS